MRVSFAKSLFNLLKHSSGGFIYAAKIIIIYYLCVVRGMVAWVLVSIWHLGCVGVSRWHFPCFVRQIEMRIKLLFDEKGGYDSIDSQTIHALSTTLLLRESKSNMWMRWLFGWKWFIFRSKCCLFGNSNAAPSQFKDKEQRISVLCELQINFRYPKMVNKSPNRNYLFSFR